jgi:glycosyltransferase involved in cell wall biosynthesis
MNLINLSVIIPMHNGIGFIDRAIQSIIDVASDLEIVIVENGSSDGSFEYLQMNYPKLSIHSIPDASKTKARNLGAKFATREVITFLDQDDEFTSGRVNPIYLENAKNGAVIIGTQEFLDSENSLMPPYLKDSYKNGRSQHTRRKSTYLG